MAPLFFHVDIDAFFASVEQLDEEGYRGLPVVVGARPGQRGVVSACSYEARAFGIHSAMPINEALRLCPQAVFLPVRMERYQECSQRVFKILEDFSPSVERVSIDEAFLDMSGTERLLGPATESASRLKELVLSQTGLCVSVGAAGNRFIAKLASAQSKPKGLIVVESGREEAFMDSLPLYKLWGAGDKTQERFRELNIRSIPELRSYQLELLQRLFGSAMGLFLYQACRGMECCESRGDVARRSVSTERTFERDILGQEIVEACLLEEAQEVMYQLYLKSLQANTIFIKLRYADFRSLSAQRSLSKPLGSSEELYRLALALLREKRESSQPLRLLGLGVCKLEEGITVQQELFDSGDGRKIKAERAIFELRQKGQHLKKARNIRLKDES